VRSNDVDVAVTQPCHHATFEFVPRNIAYQVTEPVDVHDFTANRVVRRDVARKDDAYGITDFITNHRPIPQRNSGRAWCKKISSMKCFGSDLLCDDLEHFHCGSVLERKGKNAIVRADEEAAVRFN